MHVRLKCTASRHTTLAALRENLNVLFWFCISLSLSLIAALSCDHLCRHRCFYGFNVMSESSTYKMYIHKLIAITFHSSCNYCCVCEWCDIIRLQSLTCTHTVYIINNKNHNQDDLREWIIYKMLHVQFISFDWWSCFNVLDCCRVNRMWIWACLKL